MANMEIRLQSCAPAKVLLTGEHVVLYGSKAIALAINLYCTTELHLIRSKNAHMSVVNFNLLDMNSRKTIALEKFEYRNELQNLEECKKRAMDILDCSQSDTVFNSYCILYNIVCLFKAWINDFDVSITVSSTIPVGMGLGSSAALIVSAFTVFSAMKHIKLSRNTLSDQSNLDVEFESIIKHAKFLENIVHGKSSGVDPSISCMGGALLYSVPNGIDKFTIKNTTILNKIIIIDTGVTRCTEKAIEAVAQVKTSQPEFFNELLDKASQLSESLLKKLTEEDSSSSFYDDIARNQEVLKNLGVSNDQIDYIVHRCAKRNVFVKITGAGMGGCLLAFIKGNSDIETSKKLMNQLQSEGLINSYIFTEISYDGVKVKSIK